MRQHWHPPRIAAPLSAFFTPLCVVAWLGVFVVPGEGENHVPEPKVD